MLIYLLALIFVARIFFSRLDFTSSAVSVVNSSPSYHLTSSSYAAFPFHLLQVATADGNAAHLLDKHEIERDGKAAYDELVKWYEGDELTTETAEDVKSNLEKNILSTKISASE